MHCPITIGRTCVSATPQAACEQRLLIRAYLRLFSLSGRHTLYADGRPLDVFEPELTALQLEVPMLLGMPSSRYRRAA